MLPWSVGARIDQPEVISGPPTLSRLWVGVTSPSLAASIALERSLWINQLRHPCVQKTSVFAYLVMKFAGPAQDNCGRAVCLPSQKARSALVYLTSTDLDSVEEGAPAKQRRISSVGVITDEVQKRLLERLSGYLGAYLWESGIRGQDVENCLKAERRSGVAVLAISAMQNCVRVYESLKIDEVRAMRQQFPMNLHGKQIGHILGYIPGALYGQAVLQGAVPTRVCWRKQTGGVQVAGYDACILGYDPTYSTFGSSSCGFAGGSSIESCAPGERGFGIRYGIITPDATGFQHPCGGVLFIEYEQPCYAGPCDARRSFWAYACGWSYDWRRCGVPNASKFSYFGYDSGSYDPGYPSCGHYSGSIPHATMTPAPTTPDIHHATMTSAPTTPVSYPFQMEESRPPHQWNYPIYDGKGEDMRLGMSKGKGKLPAYEREYPLPRPSIASIGGKSADASSTAGGVCCSAHYPFYATTNRCREPSASTITRCYVGSIRFRGVGTWFLSGLRAEGCACSLDEGYSSKWIAYGSFRPFGSGRIVHGKCTPTLAILAVVAVWKVPLGTEQCVAPRMPGTWCSGSLKADFLSQGA